MTQLSHLRLVAQLLRHRIIAHAKRGQKALRLRKAYKRDKALLAKAERALKAPLRVKALAIARNNVGKTMEHGSNNHGPGVERIIRYAGGDIGEPWCVDFVIWCYGHAGSKAVKPGFPRAVSMMAGPTTVRTFTPSAGDIVRYTFDHTGLFVQDNGDGTITTIEGNTGKTGAVSDSATGGDGVYKKIRSKALVRDYLRVTA